MAVETATARSGAFIGGEWLPGDGETIEVYNPATGELLGAVQSSTAAQVDAAVAAATEAFASWRKTPVLQRVDLCREAFVLCTERIEEIRVMISREVGKPIRDSRAEM